MTKIILCPEIYSIWPFDNGLMLFGEEIIIDVYDYNLQDALQERSTLDYKVNSYLSILKEDLKILKTKDYSSILNQSERNYLHQKAVDFVNNPTNSSDVMIIAYQAWDTYTNYLTNKINHYDNPEEAGFKETQKRIIETSLWKNKIFSKEQKYLNYEEKEAMKNAVIRTLSKALASVMIYQKISKLDENSNYLLFEQKCYDHAFSIATEILLSNKAKNNLLFEIDKGNFLLDTIFEYYHLYCEKFNFALVTKPEFLYEMRKKYSKSISILNQFYELFASFSHNEKTTANYVREQMERILNSLKNELEKFASRNARLWEFIDSISFFNIPVGQIINQLLKDKITNKIIQRKINEFFTQHSNHSWKNLFVLIKSFDNFEKIELTKNLKYISEEYFTTRPNW